MAMINTLNKEEALDPERSTKDQRKELDHKVNKLKKSVQEIEQDIQVLKDLQYEYDFERKVVMKEIANVLTLAEQIQITLISDELPEWKKRHQMACIGEPQITCLDQLQNWFTVVAECLQQIRQQLKEVQELVQKFTYDDDLLNLGKSQLDEQALLLFKNLILHSLVVERQPCMPTHPQRPLVLKMGVQFRVKIRLLIKLPEMNCQPKVTICVDQGFSEMETVKECTSLGNILTLPPPPPLAKSDVPTNTSASYEAQGDPEGLIHWNTFCKTSVECGGSLWHWIYENLDLTKHYLLRIWNDGYIMGFLSQETEKALLRDKLPGTFLLRFSETSRIGAIAITWVERSRDGESVVHSATYSKADLNRISLPNIIRDYTITDGETDPVNPLIYLYPDIPRDVAFSPYYTSGSEALGEMNENQWYSGFKVININNAGQ